ncbi:MAG: CHAT domain-containing protein [Cyanobacteria bacterium J06649_5]
MGHSKKISYGFLTLVPLVAGLPTAASAVSATEVAAFTQGTLIDGPHSQRPHYHRPLSQRSHSQRSHSQQNAHTLAPHPPKTASISEPSRPATLISQLIEPAANTTQTTLISEDNRTRIEGGIQVNENLFHQFDTFSLEAGTTADFVTSSGVQSVIGQVSGGHMSYVDGTLQVSGSSADLYLFNPAGILFGPSAQLNLGGSFTAASADKVGFGDAWLDIATTTDYRDFTSAPTAYQFTATPSTNPSITSSTALSTNATQPGTIINRGDLAVDEQQAIQLIGGEVINTGTLSASAGSVTLSAVPGESVIRLDTEGGLLSLEIEANAMRPATLPELITGGGANIAEELQLNSDGSLTASGMGNPSVRNTGSLSTTAQTPGQIGGDINLFGSQIDVIKGQLNASGAAGGGHIRIGGDYQGKGTLPTASSVFFGNGAIAQADALTSGNGGQIILWANEQTHVAGQLSAQGAAEGAGGLVETSGLEQLIIDETASVSTESPSGKVGTWLLDPIDLTIVDSGGTAGITGGSNTPNTETTLNVATLVSALNNNNVTLQASNAITVNAAVEASRNANGNDLRLEANTLNLNEKISLRTGRRLSGTANTVNVGTNGDLQNGVDAVATGGVVNLAEAAYSAPSVQLFRDTTIQGQGTDKTFIQGNNSSRALSISAGTITLDNVTIENGNDITGNETGGGAIRVSNTASLNLLNSLVRNNRTNSSGGGIFLSGAGRTLVENSTIEGNSADIFGGGILTENGHQLTIENSILIGNTAKHGGGIDGKDDSNEITIRNTTLANNVAETQGGAFSFGLNAGPLTVENSTIANNTALAGGGGGFFSNGAPITITGSTFRGNQATANTRGAGGAIETLGDLTVRESIFEDNESVTGGALSLISSGVTSIETTTFDNNTAAQGGAIATRDQHQVTISRSTLSNNQSINNGGAIYDNASSANRTLMIDNSTLSGNEVTSGDGGALHLNTNTQASLLNVTIANNTADASGGGISNDEGGELRLRNSLIANNIATTGSDIAGNLTSDGNNLVQSRTGSFGYAASDLANGTNPQLTPLSDNGGETLTHALLANSPAISRGNGPDTISQRGISISGLRDIGAYQRLAPSSLQWISGNDQSTVVATAFIDDLQIQVTDSLGGVLEGTDIQINLPTTGPTGKIDNSNGAKGFTDSNGLLSVSIVAGQTAGDFQLTAATGDLIEVATLTNLPDAVDQVTIIGGNNQQATVDTLFPEALRLQVSDRFDNAIAQESISFLSPATGASGRLTTPTVLTNGLGQAVTAVAANEIAGTYTVEAVVAGQTRQFTLSNTADTTLSTDPSIKPPSEPPSDPPIEPPVEPPIDSPIEQPDNSVASPPTDTLLRPSGTVSNLEENPNTDNNASENSASENSALTNLLAIDPTQSPPALDSPNEQTLESDTPKNGAERINFFDGFAFSQVEERLTEEYAKYWQQPLQGNTSLDNIQQKLQEAEAHHKAKTAVVYGLFVPPINHRELSNNRYPSVLSQRLLRNDTHNGQDQLLLMLVPPSGPPVQQLIAVTREDITRQAKLLSIEISSFLDDGYQPLARQLYDWLLAPIEDELASAGIDNLMYVLDEGLRTMPIAAMMDNERYAIEKYGISMLPSGGLLQTDFDTQPAPQNLLAAGSAEFSLQESLPAVPVELDLIKSASSNLSQTLLNEDFSIANVQATQAQNPQEIIHLATHAVFNAGSANTSYIQFWDEKLSLDELSSLGLTDLELLILSACATALGNREAELGFAGLAAAVGVESSIGSLWNVSDMGTMSLMAEFYEQLQHEPLRFSALQQAQLSLLRGSTRIEGNQLITQQGTTTLPQELTNQLTQQENVDFSHPFYWSSFTLIGNPWW